MAAVDSASAPSIRSERRASGLVRAACCGAHNSNRVSTEAILKYQIKTMSCRKTSITNACYLCNTLKKRGRVGALKVVPLLRVQKSSVIVIARRRGASRGRPVLGGSLKSLAFFAGVSESAKRLSGGYRDKGTNLRVSKPSGSGTFPTEQLGGLT